jgi:CTD kinase subunit gamma
MQDTVAELEECLKERDITTAHPALAEGPMIGASSKTLASRDGRFNGSVRLDKRQIEQRIEEDRERHKRLRESIWAVGGDDDAEFDKMWEDGSEIGEDDYLAAEEDAAERRQTVEYG